MAERRQRREWEEEMLGEWLATQTTAERVIHRIRLGPHESALPEATLAPAEKRLIGAAWRRWADAIILERGTVYVVEAALIPDPGDISRVETYMQLVPATPELDWTRGLPLKGLVVWAVEDPFARIVAVRHGLEVRIFKPSHWMQFLSVKTARETGAPRAANLLLL